VWEGIVARAVMLQNISISRDYKFIITDFCVA